MFRYYFIRWFLIVTIGLGVYAQTFGFDFVFDDHLFIVTNPFIKDFGALPAVFGSFPATRLLGMYSFALNYYFGQLDPSGYHIFNFAVHLIATAMVWLTAGLLFRMVHAISSGKTHETLPNGICRELPFLTALFFLVHPCQTQAVTYITQRYESMAAVFYLVAVYCYLRARIEAFGKRQWILFAGSAVSAVLGIMTKETALTIPVVILVAEWILVGPFKVLGKPPDSAIHSRWRLKHIWPYGAMLCAAGVFYVLFTRLLQNNLSVFGQTTPSASHDGDFFTFPTYFFTQLRVFLTFLRLLIVPAGQNLDHDFPMSTGIFSPPLTAVGLAVIGLFLWGIIRLRRSYPLVAFGLAWMLVTFSINIVPRQNAIFEHKMYLISFGFFLALTSAVAVVLKERRRALVFLGGVIVILAIAAHHRNQVWKNELTLWEDIYQKSPNKSRVNANLGRIYANQKRYDDAFRHLTKAIELKPDDVITRMNRGLLFHETGRDAEALGDINEAIRIDPQDVSLWTARAQIHMDRQDDAAAFADLDQAVRLKPGYHEPYVKRAALWMRQNQMIKSLEDLNIALKIAPREYGALVNRGAIHYQTGRYDLALEDFRRAHRVSPGVLTLKNMALSLVALGRRDEALKSLKEALKFDPNDPSIRTMAMAVGFTQDSAPRAERTGATGHARGAP